MKEKKEEFKPTHGSEGSDNGRMQEQIRRVSEMEERLNRIAAWLEDPSSRPVDEDVRILDGYYRSPLWMADFEADEAGLFPASMPRGVLSEDGIYSVLAEYEEQKESGSP